MESHRMHQQAEARLAAVEAVVMRYVSHEPLKAQDVVWASALGEVAEAILGPAWHAQAAIEG